MSCDVCIHPCNQLRFNFSIIPESLWCPFTVRAHAPPPGEHWAAPCKDTLVVSVLTCHIKGPGSVSLSVWLLPLYVMFWNFLYVHDNGSLYLFIPNLHLVVWMGHNLHTGVCFSVLKWQHKSCPPSLFYWDLECTSLETLGRASVPIVLQWHLPAVPNSTPFWDCVRIYLKRRVSCQPMS